MTRMIHCVKLDAEAEGLDTPPYPGELGDRIFQHISKQAWAMWQQQQTMLINEYRLSMIDPDARKFIQEEMEKFLFAGGSETPPGFVPPKR